MKIIWVSIESPLPANTGGRVGVYKRLLHLAGEHEIYYFYPYDRVEETNYIPELKGICREVYAYKRSKGIREIWGSLRYPFTVASRNISAMREDIEICIKKNEVDLINLDFPHMCTVVEQVSQQYHIPVVLNEHNIEWQVYLDIVKSLRNPVKKVLYYFDSNRLRSYEKMIVQRIKPVGITFVSEKDLEFYRRWINPSFAQMKLVPVGTDTDKALPVFENEVKTIALMGNMSYAPNVEGAVWFTKKVMPLIRQKLPGTVFYIVGRSPLQEVQALARNDIIVTGTVDDIDCYYKKAALIVLPIFHGGGVKVKLLEAIGRKRSIVSTTKGVEGTCYANNGLIAIADAPDMFAERCIERLRDIAAFEAEREKVYNCFLKNYTWENICKDYSDFLESCCL